MTELKTKLNDASVDDFINSLPDETQREDSRKLVKMFQEVSGHPPRMWGTSIIGFGQYHYKSERSRQEGDWMLAGFSPRKAALSLYLTTGFAMRSALLEKLGKHKQGKGCLYIKRLEDVDQAVLKELIAAAYSDMKKLNKVT